MIEIIANNEVIDQLHILHTAAINLKEKYDLKQSAEAIEAWMELYTKELDTLKRIIPESVLKKGNLLRHSAWLYRNVKNQAHQNSYSDIKDICLNDIFLIEAYYNYYLKTTENPTEKQYDWHIIHPVIFKIAKPRFESFHFADAVEASFKEINNIVKEKYKEINKSEFDGIELMRKAFSSSPNNNYNPVFKLADNTNESGRNIQQGYMEIFVGSMQGIRNPKAHANLDVNPDEAWEMIVLASHLMRMWEKNN